MSVISLEPGYTGEIRDRVENFRGQQLLYIGWDRHLMFCSPHCIPVPPDMPFSALVEQVIPGMYAQHPDAERIDWTKVEWLRSGQPFTPDAGLSVSENGLGHKAILRFRTPGLDGIAGSCN